MGILMRNRKCYTGKVKDRSQYSTDEQFTGEYWIDGKPLYEVSYAWEGSIPANGKSFDIGIRNVYEVISINAVLRASSSNNFFLLSYIAASYNTINYDADNNLLWINGTGSWGNGKVYATLRYTKTTD